jgi:hypothetical protein
MKIDKIAFLLFPKKNPRNPAPKKETHSRVFITLSVPLYVESGGGLLD